MTRRGQGFRTTERTPLGLIAHVVDLRAAVRGGIARAVLAALMCFGLLVVVGGLGGSTTGGLLASASVGAPPDPVGSDSYVAFPSATAGNDGTVEALDSMNGQVIGSGLTVGVNPGAVAVDAPASEVVVANSGDGVHSDTTASIVSNSSWSVTSTVTGLPTGSKPAAAMDVPKSLALVVDNAADDVSVISMSGTPSLVGNFSLGVSGGQPSSIATSPDGMYAYVTIPNKSDVVVLEYNGVVGDDDFVVSTTYTTSSFTPVAIAESPTGDIAYVSNTSTDVVDKFDDSPSHWSLTSSISLSAAPGAIVAAPDGEVYVSVPTATEVAAIDTVTSGPSPLVTYYSRASTPGPLALNADSSVLEMASSSTTAVELVNTATGGTAETASSLPNTPSAIASYPSSQLRFFAYVPNYGSGTVSVVDTVTDSVVQTLTVGTDPFAVAVEPDNSAVFVANFGSNSVSVIDPADILTATNPVVATVSLSSGTDPDDLALTPAGDDLLVSEYGTGQVQVVDTNPSDASYLSVVPSSSPIDLNGSGSSAAVEPVTIAVSPSGEYVYVLDFGAAAVTVLQQSAAVGGYSFDAEETSLGLVDPTDLAVAENGATAYVTDKSSSNKFWSFPVVASGGSAGELTTTGDADVVLGSHPQGVALSPEGQTAFVTNSGSDTVSDVSTSTITASGSASTGNTPSGVAVAPDGSVYLVANEGAGTVSVFSGSTSTLLATVTVGTDPTEPAFGGDFAAPGTVVDPPTSDLTGGAANASEAWQGSGGEDVHPISSSTAFSDGVDTATGDYTLRVPDFDVPDIGLPLDLYQTYDSANAGVSGPLGYGWSFSYGMSESGPTYHSATSSCTITVTQEGSSTVSFTAASSGTCPTSGYVPTSADEQGTLSHATGCHSGNPCWVLTRPDGTMYKFDTTTGQLVYIVDRDGNEVTLAYSAGDLSTVTGQSGMRSLTFTWSGGYISTVTDSLSREVAFSYSSGDLTEVTMTAPNDPTTHYFQFTYNSSPNTLEDWWSPANDPTGSGPSASVETHVYYNGSGQVDEVTEPQRSCVETSSTVNCNPETTFAWQSFDSTRGTGSVLVSDPDESAGMANGDVTLDSYADWALVSQVRGYGAGQLASAMTVSVRSPASLLPVETLDADGNATSTLYDGKANPLVSIDPLGRTTTDEYNGYSEVVATVDPMGNETTDVYNSDGDLTSSTDPLGNVKSGTYSSDAPAPSALESAMSYSTTYSYDSAGDTTTVTDPDSDVTSSHFDAVGETCETLSADSYAASHSLVSGCPTSGSSYVTVYPDFDYFGQDLKKVTPTSAPGGTWDYTYDPDGNKTSVEDPDSDTTTYSFDADDEEVSQALPSVGGTSPTTTYAYDPSGNQVTMTKPVGNVVGCSCAAAHTWTTAYDNLGRTTSSTDPLGNATDYTYDGDGNQLTVTPPSVTNPEETTNTYDADNELLTTKNNLGDESTYGYNADGEQDCAGDPNATAASITCPADPTGAVTGTTTTTYTADSKVATVTDPLGNVTTYYYDSDNNELAYTEPEGDPGTCDPLTTAHCAYTYYFTYDHADRMASTTTPPTAGSASGETTDYTYDADGSTATVTDPLGQVTTDSYDLADELTGIAYTHTVNSTSNVTYSYTNEGKTYQMADGSGTTTYSYDADQRTTEIQNGAGAVLTYTYDLDANPTCIAYSITSTYACGTSPGSSNHVVDYTYDHDDRMSTVTDWDGDVLTYTYNHDSVPQELSANSSAVTEDLSYDAGGDTTELDTKAGATTLLKLVYSYDQDGNPAQETPTIGGTTQTIENFQVDAADRVHIFWTGSGGAPSANLNYGDDGELEQNGAVSAAQGMGYDEAGELCWAYTPTSSNACSSPPTGSTTYSYDADGERTAETPSSGNDQSYDWDAANELVCANTNGSSCSIGSPTGTTTLYAYDGNGLRTSSTRSSTTTDYTWDTAQGTPRLVSSGSTDYLYGLGSAPVLQLNGSAADLLLPDPVGSVHGLVQLSSGGLQDKLVNYTDYDAYGNPSNTGGLTQGHTGINANWSVTSNIGFAGSYEDATGLVYSRGRYFDDVTASLLAHFSLSMPSIPTYSFSRSSSTFTTHVDSSASMGRSSPSPSIMASPSITAIAQDDYNCQVGLYTPLVSEKKITGETDLVCEGEVYDLAINQQFLRTSWSGPRGYSSWSLSDNTSNDNLDIIWVTNCDSGRGWYNYGQWVEPIVDFMEYPPVGPSAFSQKQWNCGPNNGFVPAIPHDFP
jgi:YVTN family beta-propeller protein/YD repeat-containing protein